MIDRLDIDRRDKDALKVCFFGREIEDIVATADLDRRERHEPASSWARRLRGAGFRLRSDFGVVGAYRPPAVDVRAHGTHVGLDFEGETLVAVLCAEPAEAASRRAS